MVKLPRSWLVSILLKSPNYSPTSLRFIHNTKEGSVIGNNEQTVEQQRLLKVAIIGVPNAGKSTLINMIMQRNVLPTSKKVHTTRSKARAILVQNQTQIVFLDTPGLVNSEEISKHNLEKTFTNDSLCAIDEADTFGVLHDVSNRYTRSCLDPKVLRLLHLYPDKDSFLILNKIDTFRSRRTLLDLANTLTCKKLKENCASETNRLSNNISEIQLNAKIKDSVGWEKFKDVFMVSALTGDGVQDIKDYLLHNSKPSAWMFPEGTLTDKQDTDLILEVVKSKLLNYLPNEVPYNLQIELEYFELSSDGNMHIVVLIGCSTLRIEKLVIGNKGSRIRKIAREAEQNLRDVFFTDVFLKLVVNEKHKTLESANAF
ncbi:GTPase Era, mitochondrial [Adelges cooleyi]|uniref:GTPase Era, mitochondrial n=1 Tax=Adelges cooleyi TaxID=133065 RepID=UPI00217FFF84|nr:GTPase Era, mitochondrial [Adelges cooleyi]